MPIADNFNESQRRRNSANLYDCMSLRCIAVYAGLICWNSRSRSDPLLKELEALSTQPRTRERQQSLDGLQHRLDSAARRDITHA